MSRRRHEEDHYQAPKSAAQQVAGLGLFDAIASPSDSPPRKPPPKRTATVSPRPAVARPGFAPTLDELAETRKRDIERAAVVALEMSHVFKSRGFTVQAIRAECLKRGIITGGEQGRALSWFGVVPRKAGLVRKKSEREYNDQGNDHVVWIHPDYVTVAP